MIFSGELISLTPSTIKAGLPINLVAKFSVATTSWWEKVNGWWAEIEIALDGMSGIVTSSVLYGSSHTLSYRVAVGPDVMTGYNLDGFLTIKCFKGGFSGYTEIVYFEPITIQAGVIPEGTFPIIPVALAVGVGMVAIAAITKKRA